MLDTYVGAEWVDTGYLAYQEGRTAHRTGMPKMVNPYGKGNYEAKEFDRGWEVEATVTRMGVS